MNFPLSPELISAILGPYGPLENVRANWPLVEAALDNRGVYSPLAGVAAISTIAVETGRFYPMRERGGPTYLANLYENRRDLGNTNPGDGATFCGRGFVQITGRLNYTHYGQEVGQDLVGNPALHSVDDHGQRNGRRQCEKTERSKAEAECNGDAARDQRADKDDEE